MFTGLIEYVGSTLWIRHTSDSIQLSISVPELSRGVRKGDSIAVNGCCLTVSSHRGDQISFSLLEETLSRTNLKELRPDSPVNLERALSAEGRLGGHFVQGHVDCTATLSKLERHGRDLLMVVHMPKAFEQYIAFKGSIAINGVSLTVAEVTAEKFSVWVIPHTRKHTNIDTLTCDNIVNLEVDIIAKYTERILAVNAQNAS
ncbi:MAG: riboflavin synthase [Chthoniobacterales bacterium]